MLTRVEPTKVCARCKQRKPWSAYHPRRRWPDGTTRQPQGYCKDCARTLLAEWRAANPERKREHERRAYVSRQNDPERLGIRREQKRQSLRRTRGYKTERLRGNLGASPIVDAAPFVVWLRTLGTSSREIAEACGMTDGTVRALLRGDRVSVYLDTVDAALIHANTLTTLDDLYPLEDAA